MYNAYKGVSR